MSSTGSSYDVVIIGSGPAGMSAAVSSAAEGYHTLVVEAGQVGGQAAGSSRIENVIGFPIGIPGHVLMEQTRRQAERLGVEFLQARAYDLFPDGERLAIIADPHDLSARAVVLAMGVTTRKLTAPGCEELEGRGVYYMTTPRSEEACLIRPAVVVGAGNSAGQAAVHLSQRSPRVVMVVRGAEGSLRNSMSAYLVRRIERTPNIEVRYRSEVVSCYDTGNSVGVQLFTHSNVGTRYGDIDAGGVYVMIGAAPNTEWTGVDLDAEGYIVAPDMCTSMPNVFAVGDVRSGSVKRVASAAGEGAHVMRWINRVMRPELYSR